MIIKDFGKFNLDNLPHEVIGLKACNATFCRLKTNSTTNGEKRVINYQTFSAANLIF
jgi:hypothetical protein